MPIIPDSLYDLAYAYKKTKLWKRLWDSQLFAVQMEDGQVGYCSVMGKNGEHIALGVYMGQVGLDSYRDIYCGDFQCITDEYGHELPSLQSYEHLMRQNCVQCAFENKADMRERSVDECKNYAIKHGLKLVGARALADFVRYFPQHFPWYVRDTSDQKYIAQALEAAIEVSKRLEAPTFQGSGIAYKKLGLIEGEPYDREIPLLIKKADGYEWSSLALPDEVDLAYPSPTISDIHVARIRKTKKSDKNWYCDVVMMPDPVSDENGEDGESIIEPTEAPYFAYMLLVIVGGDGLVLLQPIVPTLDEKCCTEMVCSLAEAVIKTGKPHKLLTRKCDTRTQAILGAFAQQVGIPISECDEDDYTLIDEELDLFEHFSNVGNASQDEMLSELVEQLSQLSDAELRSLPSDFRDMLLDAARAGQFEAALEKRLIHLFGGK